MIASKTFEFYLNQVHALHPSFKKESIRRIIVNTLKKIKTNIDLYDLPVEVKMYKKYLPIAYQNNIVEKEVTFVLNFPESIDKIMLNHKNFIIKKRKPCMKLINDYVKGKNTDILYELDFLKK